MTSCHPKHLEGSLTVCLHVSEIIPSADAQNIFCIASRDTTKTSLQTWPSHESTAEENIEKKIVQIEGKVGSGKTLLGTEIVKMKLAHYIRKYNLRVDEMQQKIKVIILADDFNANVLVQQLKEDLFKDIGQYCDIEISSKELAIRWRLW